MALSELAQTSSVNGVFFFFVVYWIVWIIYCLYRMSIGDVEIVQRHLHKQYGPLIRIAPDKVVSSDPDTVSRIYTTQNPFKKTDWYVPLRPRGISEHADLFTETEEEKHTKHNVQHNKKLFGEDAMQFRPERWLESQARNFEMEKGTAFFGARTRTCTGENIALAEVHKLVPELLPCFDMRMAHCRPWKTRNAGFVKQTDIVVKLAAR